MTLILAVRSRNGIVLASDGQATTDAAGQPTKTSARKLYDLGGRIAWGAAGSIGLQQTLISELEELQPDRHNAAWLRRQLASVVIPLQQEALRDYVPQPGSEPPDLACLFTWWDRDGPWILSLPRTGSDHQFHPLYAAIGTGDIFAEFAMVSIRRLGAVHLDLDHAKMLAYKAIADAIEVAAVYIGPPIQMYVVTMEGAGMVPQEELEGEIASAVSGWETRQREMLAPLTAVASTPLPTAQSVSR